MESNFEKITPERAVLVGLNADCFTQAQTARPSHSTATQAAPMILIFFMLTPP